MRLPLCTSLAHLMDLLLLFSLSLSPFLLDSLLPFLLPSLHPTFLPSAYLCLLFHIIFNSSHVFSFIFVPLFFFHFPLTILYLPHIPCHSHSAFPLVSLLSLFAMFPSYLPAPFPILYSPVLPLSLSFLNPLLSLPLSCLLTCSSVVTSKR